MQTSRSYYTVEAISISKMIDGLVQMMLINMLINWFGKTKLQIAIFIGEIAKTYSDAPNRDGEIIILLKERKSDGGNFQSMIGRDFQSFLAGDGAQVRITNREVNQVSCIVLFPQPCCDVLRKHKKLNPNLMIGGKILRCGNRVAD